MGSESLSLARWQAVRRLRAAGFVVEGVDHIQAVGLEVSLLHEGGPHLRPLPGGTAVLLYVSIVTTAPVQVRAFGLSASWLQLGGAWLTCSRRTYDYRFVEDAAHVHPFSSRQVLNHWATPDRQLPLGEPLEGYLLGTVKDQIRDQSGLEAALSITTDDGSKLSFPIGPISAGDWPAALAVPARALEPAPAPVAPAAPKRSSLSELVDQYFGNGGSARS